MKIMKNLLQCFLILFFLCVCSFGQVPSTYWGIHYNNATSLTPPNPPLSFNVIRLWDTRTGWADMQTTASCTHTITTGCNFTQLQTWLNKFSPSQKLILTLFKTPNFIASDVTDANCGYTFALGNPNGSCTPPTDLNCDGTGTDATWIQFITALWDWIGVNGFAGRITYLEIGNEFNIVGFWDNVYINTTLCGSTPQAAEKMLLRMEQDARCVVKGVNCNLGGTFPVQGAEPAVLFYTPSVSSGGATIKPGGTYYNYISLGGGTYSDIMSIHSYVGTKTGMTPPCGAVPANSGCPWPENIVTAITQLKTDQTTFGLNMPLAFSEGSWGLGTGASDAQYQQAFVGRYYTLMAQYGAINFDWYNIDGNPIESLYSNITTGALTNAGQAVQTIEGWLTGKTFTSAAATIIARSDCSDGAGSNVYESNLTSGERVIWYDSLADNATCSYTNLSGFRSYTKMDNSVTSLTGVVTLTLDNRAILLSPGTPAPPHGLTVLSIGQ